MSKYILFCLILLLTGCIQEVSITPDKFNCDDTVRQVEHWLLIGPFGADSAQAKSGDYIDSNYLFPLGIREEATFFSRMKSLAVIRDKQQSLFRSNVVSFPAVNLMDGGQRVPAVQYLAATVESERADSAILLASGMQTFRMWVNDTLIYSTPFKKSQSKYYEEYIPVVLKKGRNNILVKLGVSEFSTVRTHWKLSVHLASVQYAEHNFAKDYAFDFVRKSIVDSGKNVSVYLGPHIKKNNIPFELKDGEGTIVFKTRLNPLAGESMHGYTSFALPDSLAGNLFSANIYVGRQWLSQDIYFGDFLRKFKEIEMIYSSSDYSGWTQDQLDLHASFERLKYLMRVYLKGEAQQVRYWDRSRVLFMKELMAYYDQLSNKKHQTNSFNGMINGYISTIDTSKQHYLFHISNKLKTRKEKVPLIMVVPFPTVNDAPLLKSWFISNMDQVLWDSRLADEHEFAIMWVNLRGNPGTNAIGTADFMECLHHAVTNHNIDTNSVFVLGNSAAVPKALSYAVRFPYLIAGCALVNPVFDASPQMKGLIDQIGNLKWSHVIIKAEEKDEEVPIAGVRAFYDKYIAQLKNGALIVSNRGSHLVAPRDNYREIFRFFSNKKQITRHADSVMHFPDKYKTQIEQVFGAPFLVVYSNGSEKMAEEFNNLWLKKFFAPSPRKCDADISENDIRKYNLVAVGNERNNSIIKRIAHTFPLKFTEDSIVAGNKVFRGKSLLCYVAVPPATNSRRRSLVIGTHNFKGVLPLKDVANEGQYDYMLFETRDSTFRLVEAGDF